MSAPNDAPRIGTARVALWVFACAVFAFLILPALIVVPLSFNATNYLRFPPTDPTIRWYAKYLTDPDWIAATRNTLIVATIATTLSTVLGTLAAVGLARRSAAAQKYVRQLFVLPMTVPEILIAVSLYYFYALVGMTGLKMIDSLWGVAIGHSVLALPITFLMVTASLATVDPALERASLSLGAGRVRTFFKVTFPLIRAGVFGSACLAFLTSLNDVLIALFVSGVGTKTLTKKMWDSIRFELDPTVAAASSSLIVATIVVLICISLFLRQREATASAFERAG